MSQCLTCTISENRTLRCGLAVNMSELKKLGYGNDTIIYLTICLSLYYNLEAQGSLGLFKIRNKLLLLELDTIG